MTIQIIGTIMAFALVGVIIRCAVFMIRKPHEVTWIHLYRNSDYVNEIYYNRRTNPHYHRQIRLMGWYMIVCVVSGLLIYGATLLWQFFR